MVWARLDDQFANHPKVVRLSDAAFRLHVAGICYCACHLTDGEIAALEVPRLVPGYRPKALAELVDRGLWERNDDTYLIRAFLEYNPSKEKVEQQRAEAAERKARWNASRNASKNASRTRGGTLPRPDPTRPEGSRGGSTGLPSAVVSAPAPSGGAANVVRLRCDVCGGRGVVLLDCGDAVDCECKRKATA